MNLSKFPRLRCGHWPTPLEPMPRLSEHLGGPELWVKRDDCTGLSTGGNKTRKLEFLVADAIDKKADVIITQGATQSNHARQTAALCAKVGIECQILLEDRTGFEDFDYKLNGNVLLDRLHGAKVSQRPGGADMQAEMESLAESLAKQGRRPYVIPGGGSNPIGALGYVNAALELTTQLNEMNLDATHLVLATGSSGTHAGLIAGLSILNSPLKVVGFGVRAPKEKQEQMVYDLACKTAALLGHEGIVDRQSVFADCDYVGSGYGLPTPAMVEAVTLLAQTEGLLFDPVYTGKGLSGMIDWIRKGKFNATDKIVFLHTGGSAALFGYPETFGLPGYSDS
ncbi:D-cysteine desulfhydrase [Orrella daihaiensis]|uniref:D-cysteine desulfhydrase n=1 Tax=Orrella daihaiensis TaxID=2782176 RepID=A0ABY4AH33_9BURK|nr:D-cysteine desulfhydrase [Orrella daihaiensis]UOD49494.1 D-cysteine desulfhydrase [Orrella daihaiensis]